MELIERFVQCSGYMAPEYALHGYLSVKTDVFSYGVLVLEIVSGRKNHDGRLGTEKVDLLSYVSQLHGRFRCYSSLNNFIYELSILCVWNMQKLILSETIA